MRCPSTAPPAAPVAILVLTRLTSLCIGPCITTPSVLHFSVTWPALPAVPTLFPAVFYLAALTSLSASKMSSNSISNCTGRSSGSHSPSAMFSASSLSTSAFGTSPTPDLELRFLGWERGPIPPHANYLMISLARSKSA